MIGILAKLSSAAPAPASDPGSTLFSHLPPLKRIRRQLISPIYRIADTGLCGLTPLRTHVLICGFPRSGTTLLQMMLENALPDARRFGREIGGWRAATWAWRNHAVLISKVPHDIFRLEPLRRFYRARPASLRIILMHRDPRDVLTSRRTVGGPDGYCVGAQRWRRYHAAFMRHRRDRDVLVVGYEQLVGDPHGEQSRVERFTGLRMRVPFAEFHAIPRDDFDTSTLNGLRPVEQSLVGRWAAPDHRARIRQALDEIPELPETLIELEYERDAEWVAQVTKPSAEPIFSVLT